jgi:O-antigen ligase
LFANFSYVLLAQSPGPILALVVTLIAWQLGIWFFHGEYKSHHRNMLLILLVLLSAASVLFMMAHPEFFKRSTQRMRGFWARLELWNEILIQVKNAPLFGHGLPADVKATVLGSIVLKHPHNVYLATMFYGGLVGFLLMIGMMFSTFWQGFKRIRKPGVLVYLCMVLFGSLCMVTDGNMLIHHPKPFWLFFWFPVALLIASELPDHYPNGELETAKAEGREVRGQSKTEILDT